MNINKLCPDFISFDGKVAIEVFYKGHKEKFRGGFNCWKQNREEIFNRNGIDIMFFDEKQLNDNMVLNKLNENELVGWSKS